MKKIMLTFAIVALVLSSFYLKASAAELAPNGKSYTYVYDYYYGKHGSSANSFTTQYQGKIYSNLKLAVAPVTFPTNTSYSIYAYVNDSLVKIDAGGNQNSAGINSNYDNFYLDWTGSPATPSSTWTLVGASENPTSAYGTVVTTDVYSFTSPVQQSDVISYLTTPDVNFDTVIYNPLIPTPKIQVLMLPYLTTALEADTEYTFVQMIADDYPDYYIQVMAKYTVPESIRIGSNNGQFTYDVISYADPQTQVIYALEELTQCQDISIGTYEDFWGWFPTVLPEIHYSVPAWENNPSNSLALQAKERWNDYLRNYMPLYGNQMEIYARLYLVDDGQIFCGAWRHWQSSSPSSFTEEIPDTYQPGYELPGYVNTDNNTDVPSGNTINEIGTPTGQNSSTTVVVNQNVPNYPDYPTVASYNQDNILLKFMNTANHLSGFFGEFTDFLIVSFAFIPSEIWQIIGFGFLASIVIMIIKVL